MANPTDLLAAITGAMSQTPSGVQTGQNPDMSVDQPGEDTGQGDTKVIERDRPTPEVMRAAAVSKWNEDVVGARAHWEKQVFDGMRRNMKLTRGDQWGDGALSAAARFPVPDLLNDDVGARYVANITLRHINSRTAAIYGKNPKFVARRAERLLSTVWDGSQQQVKMAMQTMAGGDPGAMVEAQAILEDATQTMAQHKQMDTIAKTLEILFAHEIAEQPVPFKVQMKATVRRALTASVGYVKVGYSRVMGMRPELETELNDMSEQLATLERLSADIADGEVQPDSAEADQLKSMIAAKKIEQPVVVREGLSFSYPNSTAIIPDTAIQQLRGFVGADWVAEEFLLSADRIKEIWKIDVAATGGARAYQEVAGRMSRGNDNNDRPADQISKFCVWEIYNKVDGLVYVVCDGYPDYLAEPAEPDVWSERFYPWLAFVTNEIYDEGSVFPPSDVDLLRDMQLEINRSRQGLREHRRAARPMTIARAGTLEKSDKEKLQNHKANEIVELSGLPEAMKVVDALVAWNGAPVDPNLYSTDASYQDMQRVIGDQEANLGGTSGATATETSIAEGSRMSSVGSIIDDLDEFLTEMARMCGQILMKETSEKTVKEIVGPGALWPVATRDQIAKEIYLDVEAASTGRPNKAVEIQNATQMMPLLMQIPGLSPEWLAREMLRRMDDRVDLSDAFASGMPSIQQINAVKQQALLGGPPQQPGDPNAPPGGDPNAQGPQGANNAQSTQPPQVNAAPRPPGAPPQMPAPGQ